MTSTRNAGGYRSGAGVAFAVAICLGTAAAANAQSGFTYQGQLRQGSTPVNGTANLEFGIYDSANGPGLIGSELHNGVPVSNGLFTVILGQDSQWDGLFSADLWLEITVNGTTLAPRQPITKAPRAISADSLTLPFDSSPNQYASATPVFLVQNQGTASAVHGLSLGSSGVGVWGEALTTTGLGYGGHFVAHSPTGYGVLGTNLATTGAAPGVFGSSSSVNGFGVYGGATAGYGVGVYGTSSAPNGVGVLGRGLSAGSFGGYFDHLAGGIALHVQGTARVSVLEILGGADIAEPFNINSVGTVCDRDIDFHSDRQTNDIAIQPGMVVSIDPARVGELRLATKAYDSAVAGIISGANGVDPGMVLKQEGTVADGKHPVAMTGRVWCWCDADANGPIVAGDRLTTSNTPGHAMRVTAQGASVGAVIGKAMSNLEHGQGLVLVLVNLQ